MLPIQFVGGPPAAVLSEGSVGLCVASATAAAMLSRTVATPQVRTANRRTASASASRQSGASSRFGARVATVAISHPQNLSQSRESPTRTLRSSEVVASLRRTG